MKSLVFVVTVLAAVLSVSAREISDRIIGGSDAPEGQYPYQVSLRRYTKHFCGGSIINKRWIVTAAQCINRASARNIKVIAGTDLLSESGESYQADILLPHPKYDSAYYVNDIGLIHVDRDIEFNPKVQPIELPNSDFAKEGHPALLSGWGRTSVGSELSDRLQHINLTISDEATCSDFHWALSERHICTFTKVGEGPCYGDFGGPLTADGVLIGVVSYGMPCAIGYPDIYARVYKFVDWINQNAKI